MGFDIGIVGWHQRYDVLVQPRCGLGAEISCHAVALVRFMGPRVDEDVYGVKLIRQSHILKSIIINAYNTDRYSVFSSLFASTINTIR